jgi:long-chain fatty acid transport protein
LRGDSPRRGQGIAALIAGIAIAATSSTARAGGLEVPDVGTKSLGRGSAFVARADDTSAMVYNPAGLWKSKGVNVQLGANLLNMNARFARRGSDEWVCPTGAPETCDPTVAFSGRVFDPANDPNSVTGSGSTMGGAAFPEVRRKLPISPMPTLFVNWGGVGGVKGLSIGAGVFTPAAFGFSAWDASGPQRYNLRSAQLLVVYPAFSIAYSVNRYFSFGATFVNGITQANFSLAARGVQGAEGPIAQKEDPYRDSEFQIDVRDWSSPHGIVGVLSHPIDPLELGVSFRTPVIIKAKGQLGLVPSQELLDAGGADIVSPALVFEQTLPWIVRAGARYIHPRFDVEANYVFENWGRTGDGFLINFSDATAVNLPLQGTIPLVDTLLPKYFRDVHSVRLGSDVVAIPRHLDVRLGTWWQSSAYPKDNATFGVDFPVGLQVGVSAGLTWHAIPRKTRLSAQGRGDRGLAPAADDQDRPRRAGDRSHHQQRHLPRELQPVRAGLRGSLLNDTIGTTPPASTERTHVAHPSRHHEHHRPPPPRRLRGAHRWL